MTFSVSAEAYEQFMGRWSAPLASRFVELADPRPGQRALDVGCGPGQLTAELVDWLGVASVVAVDPSASFVGAVRERFPGLDARAEVAERLPFDDDSFDLAACQLVVHFMTDPVAGLAEMGRVVRPGGSVLASVWDFATTGGPLAAFWQAVAGLDPAVTGEAQRPGAARGQLEELAAAAGLTDVEGGSLTVTRSFETFEDWWDPYLLGVGPAGDYVLGLDDPARARLRDRCREVLPGAPFTLEAVAWTVHARSA